ncbi:nucleotide exchange factor GrpE [Lacicoccus alkaliphilus]|uniref:Protein GrpE n=1 Tax=Lacicoccus alkaliphilus DSM 16010 TaxID=1123231 RepID=A0A1M7BMM5_9BACL|nr:nucleotide exchange factor GrpE [Salinicoccus alkaliphilus]SHL56244.1 molecular chaperone GrpE [Salinicoccus alkaliphilus DSM 16010]
MFDNEKNQKVKDDLTEENVLKQNVEEDSTDEKEQRINEDPTQEESASEEVEETAESESFEESSAVSEETADEIDETQQELEKLKEEAKKYEDKYFKLYAEFENFKRRNKQEIDLNNKYKDQKFAENLLPVLDNLERAMEIEGDNESFASLKKGVEMVYNDFLNIFSKHDITVIEAKGKEFDPNFHQAVMTESSSEDSGIVIEEFQKGYQLKDRVIRASMVKVSE